MIPTRAVEAAGGALVYHQRKDITSCMCGWSELGRSHASHQAQLALEAAAPYMLEPFSRIADNLRSTSDSHRKMAEYDPTFIAHLEIARELGAAALNIRRVIDR